MEAKDHLMEVLPSPSPSNTLEHPSSNLQDPSVKVQNPSIPSQPSLTIQDTPSLPQEHLTKTEPTPSVPQDHPLQIYDIICLTGFNKFGTYTFNPTELAVNVIQKDNLPGVVCQVLDCSMQGVDQYIQKMQEILPSLEGKRILHLHLGVGGNLYELEKQAFNFIDFGDLADNKGRRPQGEVIVKDGPSPIKTVVDITNLKLKMDAQFDVRVSSDPGLFVCNYIYYLSLYKLHKEFPGNDSLFVHIPYRSNPNKYLQKDVRCIEDLIENLQRKRHLTRDRKLRKAAKHVFVETVKEVERVVEIVKEVERVERHQMEHVERMVYVHMAKPVQALMENMKEVIKPQEQNISLEWPLIQYDHIYLTGFDTYQDKLTQIRTFNPTEELVHKLQVRKIPGLTCKVVGCSMKEATSYIASRLEVDVEEGKSKLHLHLGVGGTDYDLECFAKNQNIFGNILDNNKQNQNNKAIMEGFPLHHRLKSHVGIAELNERLGKEMKGKLPAKVKVQTSDDAGSFICNYIYYKSCHYLQRGSNHSLFFHIPDRKTKEDLLAETDLKCILALLDILMRKKKNLTTE